MGLPGKRRSAAKGRRGRAHLAAKAIQTTTCPNCKKPMLPHRACPHCGMYAGRKVAKAKTAKK